MSERIEKLINDYPSMIREQALLANQIKNFRGLSEIDMIESMVFNAPEGERVQTSGVSQKTANVAVSYSTRILEMNQGWVKNLEMEYALITEEILFFQSAIDVLEPKLSELMKDLVIDRMQWDEIIRKHHISKTMVAKRRKKAIKELEYLYEKHNEKITKYLLD